MHAKLKLCSHYHLTTRLNVYNSVILASLKFEENADWFLNSLFKDECHFQQSGHINKLNMCVCESWYPHKYTKQKMINNFHVRVKTGKQRNRRLLENFIYS